MKIPTWVTSVPAEINGVPYGLLAGEPVIRIYIRPNLPKYLMQAEKMARAVGYSWCAQPLEVQEITMLCSVSVEKYAGGEVVEYIMHTQECAHHILARRLCSGEFSEEVRSALKLHSKQPQLSDQI